jgi:cellulose biosynthesis protein BcsQ
MKSVVFFNNKGGVGKTTLLCNVASYLSVICNKKVLVIDADPQCNSTTYCLDDNIVNNIYIEEKRNTIESFLEPIRKGKGYLREPIEPERSKRFKFSIVPGDPKLSLSEDLLAADWKGASSGDPRGLQTSFVFRDLVAKYEAYDYVFFDVGPSLGAINRAIMLASDYFVVPMSVDIFSLMAIDNISLSLVNWKRGLERALSSFEENEGHKFEVANRAARWKLQFAGYVIQQYTAKTVRGKRVPVTAYENIASRMPDKISEKIVDKFTDKMNVTSFNLGEVHNLHSLVPLSQTANSPIFKLKASDGVVGAHFAKVRESVEIFKKISNNLMANLGDSHD